MTKDHKNEHNTESAEEPGPEGVPAETAAQPPAPKRRTRVTRNPERTAAAIMAAATQEFAEKGMGGARIDVIARRAGTNKRMLYHYFGDKEALYLAVLEEAYFSIRHAEHRLDLTRRDPEDGIRELALFTWHYFLDHPEFLGFLAAENQMRARYLKRSTRIRSMHSNLIIELESVLARGAASGVFKPGLDPVGVYLTIAALGFFYLSNRYTLSTIFNRELEAPDALEQWGNHIAEVTLAHVRA